MRGGRRKSLRRSGQTERRRAGCLTARAHAGQKGTRFFKRSGDVLREGIEMKYRMIERCREAFPIRLMCRCLKISPSGYYAWRERPPSARAQDYQRLLKRIETLHSESDGVFGSPRMWAQLRYGGESCSLNRVARLMRQQGLRGIPQRTRWRKKSVNQHPEDVSNHLKRDFTAQAPNTKWVTDITYVRTAEHWLYQCVVLDLYSGIVVGRSMSHRQERQLVLQAVLMALWQREARTPVILHSDRGCQFTSDEYQRFLKGHHLICSMSAVGSCADNAAAESFFGVLKRERVNRRQYLTRAEARADIFDYIERFHNPRKRQQRKTTNARRQTRKKPKKSARPPRQRAQVAGGSNRSMRTSQSAKRGLIRNNEAPYCALVLRTNRSFFCFFCTPLNQRLPEPCWATCSSA